MTGGDDGEGPATPRVSPQGLVDIGQSAEIASLHARIDGLEKTVSTLAELVERHLVTRDR